MDIDSVLSKLKAPSGIWSRSQTARKAAEKLLAWLTNASRSHDVGEDEKVQRALLSSPVIHWIEINAANIPLLPPLPDSPHYTHHVEFLAYLTVYKNRPARPPTVEEIWRLLSDVVGHTSYPKEVLPVLFEAGFTLRDELVVLPEGCCHTPPIGNGLLYNYGLDTLKMMLDVGMRSNYIIRNAETGREFRYNMLSDAKNRGREDVIKYLEEKYSL